MAKKPGPSVRRRQLGALLRQLRHDSGKTIKDAAEWLDIGQSAVSKIEKAKQTIKSQTVRALCQLYDVDASTTETLLRLAREANQRGWWAAYRDTLPEWARQIVGLEADAETVWSYQAEYVPGLLQTEDYLKAITRTSAPDIPEHDLTRKAQLRGKRQELLDAEHPPRLRFYLNEAVLRRPVGGPRVMRAQLEQLVDCAGRDHIDLRVVPFAVGAHPAMSNSFVAMQFPEEDAPAFVYVEHYRGSVYQEDPGDVDHCMFMVRELDRLTVSPEDSRAMLVEAAAAL